MVYTTLEGVEEMVRNIYDGKHIITSLFKNVT
jgi:hypothetical protein